MVATRHEIADKRRVVHQSPEIGSEGRQKNCKYWNLHAEVTSNCSLIATQNSHAKHNESVGRIPEHQQKKSCTSKDEMISERRPNHCKYGNLRPVVMSNCSLIGTRNSHATHNKSVGRIPECGQTRVARQSHKMRSKGGNSFLQVLEFTSIGIYIL